MLPKDDDDSDVESAYAQAPAPGPSEAGKLAQKLADGWSEHEHPDGSLYYYHRKTHTVTNSVRTASSDAPFDPLPLAVAKSAFQNSNSERPPDLEVYVKQGGAKPRVQWIDHELELASKYGERLQDFRAKVKGDLLYTSRYWSFIHRFPDHVSVSFDLYHNEAVKALTWCYADGLLFGQRNTTFSQQGSSELLAILEDLQTRGGSYRTLKTWFIGCILEAIYFDRYYMQHGPLGASSDEKTERQETTLWPWLIAVVYHAFEGVVCFGVTNSYLQRIQAVDRTYAVSTYGWQSSVLSLLSEWRDSNLVATVLLAANIAFLALTDIDSVTRVLCSISTLCSLGSVGLGSYLARIHQEKQGSTVHTGMAYFSEAKIGTSLLPLAFVLSLPIVLLLWALLSFMAAVCDWALREVASDAPIIKIWVIIILAILGISAILSWKFFHPGWVHRPHSWALTMRPLFTTRRRLTGKSPV